MLGSSRLLSVLEQRYTKLSFALPLPNAGPVWIGAAVESGLVCRVSLVRLSQPSAATRVSSWRMRLGKVGFAARTSGFVNCNRVSSIAITLMDVSERIRSERILTGHLDGTSEPHAGCDSTVLLLLSASGLAAAGLVPNGGGDLLVREPFSVVIGELREHQFDWCSEVLEFLPCLGRAHFVQAARYVGRV